jgi:hypothetical protein
MRGVVEIRGFLISPPLRSDYQDNNLTPLIYFDITLGAVRSRLGCNSEDKILNTPTVPQLRFSFWVGWDWVQLVRRPLFGILFQPQMIDDEECGAVRGLRIGRDNRSTRRKPAPVPLFPPQIPRDLTWARTRAVAVGSRRSGFDPRSGYTGYLMDEMAVGQVFSEYFWFSLPILIPRTVSNSRTTF